MPRKAKKTDRKLPNTKLSLAILASILLLLWEMILYRKTFIPLWLVLAIFFVGGAVLFFTLKKRFLYFTNRSFHILIQLLIGILLFGSPLIFLFVGTNYYLADRDSDFYTLKIKDRGELAAGRGGCGNPYVVVKFRHAEKKLIFPCGTDVYAGDSVQVELLRGALGFFVVKRQLVIDEHPLDDPAEVESIRQYDKILRKAEAYSRKGNKEKALEYYRRALKLKPKDTVVRSKIEKLKGRQL